MFVWREKDGEHHGSDGLTMYRVTRTKPRPALAGTPYEQSHWLVTTPLKAGVLCKTLEEAKAFCEAESQRNPTTQRLMSDALIDWHAANWPPDNSQEVPKVCAACNQLVYGNRRPQQQGHFCDTGLPPETPPNTGSALWATAAIIGIVVAATSVIVVLTTAVVYTLARM